MMYLDGRKASLYEYMYERLDRTESFLSQLMLVRDELGSDGLMKLLSLKNSTYLMYMRINRRIINNFTNENLSVIAPILIEYYENIKQMEIWAVKAGM